MDRTWHRHGTDHPSGDDGLHTLWPCSSKQLSRRTTWSTSSQVKRAAGDPVYVIPTDLPVRVESRLTPEVARRLFAVAEDTGRTVSAVVESALRHSLPEERAM